MNSSRLLEKAAEIFARPVRLAVYGLGVASLVAGSTFNSAMAQQQWSAPSKPYAPYTAPADPGPVTGEIVDGDDMGVPVAPGEEGAAVPAPGSELPDVADLSGDTGFASAGQTAAPTVIGDTMSFGNCGMFSNLIGGSPTPVCFSGGRKYKATVNQSACPQDRVFYEFNYFNGAINGAIGDEVDVTRHTVGFERVLDGGCSSIQVHVPFNSLGTDIDTGAPYPTDTNIGNVSVAYKRLIDSTCGCKSIGVALDIPTAPDTNIDGATLAENKAFTLIPFYAFLDNSGGILGADWAQGFVSLEIPLNDNQLGGVDVSDLTVLHLDYAIGRWLNQDSCGNGLAAVAEVHYSTALDDENVAFGAETFVIDDFDVVNLTLGAQIFRGCWTVTPAYVTPLTGDVMFDWEFACHVNRRF